MRRRERGETSASPFWRQQGWIFSAAFLVMVIVMAAGVLVTRAADKPVTAAQAQPSTGPRISGAPPADGRPGGCRTDDSDRAKPTAPPSDVQWQEFPYGKVPVSASSGPRRQDGALWWCYAHTPLGAVLAAHVIPTQVSSSGWRAVVSQQVVAGPVRDALLARPDAAEADAPGDTVGSYIGFAISSYSASAASVWLLIRAEAQSFAPVFTRTRVALNWDGGDWKVVAQSSGSLFTPLESVTASTGFVMWGA